MGLVKTVFSPFTNTTPLVSIILVVVLVAIFRFSGGGISVGEVKNKNNVKQTKQTEEVKQVKEESFPSEGVVKMDADEVRQLINLRPKPKPTPKQENKKGNSLDDIERRLGMRKE